MKAILAACVVVAGAAQPLGAQQANPEPNGGWIQPVARYGKWLGIATAIALTGLAVREHTYSSENWNQLLDICRVDNADCAIGPDGAYLNTVAEGYYQRSLYYDARARRRLMYGQVALVAGTALFIVDMGGGPNGPKNIPFDPNRIVVAPTVDGGAKVGLRLAF
jgi:hypothetical protein